MIRESILRSLALNREAGSSDEEGGVMEDQKLN